MICKFGFVEVMSSAGWSNWDDVSLLAHRHILRTDNSAIARMSEGEAVANGTANVSRKSIERFVGMM